MSEIRAHNWIPVYMATIRVSRRHLGLADGHLNWTILTPNSGNGTYLNWNFCN